MRWRFTKLPILHAQSDLVTLMIVADYFCVDVSNLDARFDVLRTRG